MSANYEDIKEKLAAIEHERWSDWQKWCHKVLRDLVPSAALEKVLERWDRQIATPYEKLTPEELASDMEQVDRYWPLIEELLSNISIQSRIDELKKLPNTKPVWFDPKLHTNYVDKRVAELEAQLKTQQDTTRQESEEK